MTILIVDDSKAMRMILRRTLRQAGIDNHTIEEAGGGPEALEMLPTVNPDLVLSDWNMPEMNGLEMALKIKEKMPEIKFGFVTSETSPEVRKAATGAGALFLIAKPFTPEDFERVLGSVLS